MNSDNKICPSCNNQVTELVIVDAGLKLRLAEIGGEVNVPDQVCSSCFKNLSEQMSVGAKIQLSEKFKEQQKLEMWKSRVHLLKQGRFLMSKKMFSEAAVAYEKYIRILEVIYKTPMGGLNPEVFKNAHKIKELTVITSVYWDLLRIYDTNPRYANRQKEAAGKLNSFLNYTPIANDILRKAKNFVRKSKNPQVIKSFLKSANANQAKCFIASVCFVYPFSYEVKILCWYRDNILLSNFAGRHFTNIYYKISPFIANFINKSIVLKSGTRFLLIFLVKLISFFYKQDIKINSNENNNNNNKNNNSFHGSFIN